jgi:uncharacterized membrane protein YfhO
MINSPAFDPSVTAIMEKDPGVKTPDSTSVEVEEYHSRRIKVRAYTSAPALLVLSEIYYPAGWKAFVDGHETEILRTNSILRSVVVPAGSHEIVFSFDPESYALGWIVTNAAWGITALCIIGGLWFIPSVRGRLTGGREKQTTTA